MGDICLRLRDADATEDQFELALLLEPNSVEARVGPAKAQIAERSFASVGKQLRPVQITV